MLEKRHSQTVYLRYTVRALKSEMLLRAAQKQRIFLGDWYRTGIAPDLVDYEKILYDPASCPLAEKIARETVNLPTDIHITIKDAQRIVTFLKQFYAD